MNLRQGQEWEHEDDGERIRIERVWQGRDPSKPDEWTVLARVITGPAYFSASDLGPGEFLAAPEWITSRYRLVA